MSAEPYAGYRFKGWRGDVSSSTQTMVVDMQNEINVQAAFELVDDRDGTLVINEINYNSEEDFNPDDWIELYANRGDFNLGGWVLRDDNDEHKYIIPPSTILYAGEYLVLTRNISSFRFCFPDVENVLGDLNFGFSSEGDQVRLYNSIGQLIDSVAYTNNSPWNDLPDGHGPTLQLINPAFDNRLPHNWGISVEPHGDPGRENRSTASVIPVDDPEGNPPTPLPTYYKIVSVYPNPFNKNLTITIDLPEMVAINISVYNILGQFVGNVTNENYSAGTHQIVFNPSGLASGIYFVHLEVSDKIDDIRKIVLLK